MILLHGGLSYTMLSMLLAGAIGGLVIIIVLHRIAVRSNFYETEFVNYSTIGKIVAYLFFLAGTLLIAYASMFVIGLIVGIVFG